jgi:hypothetical protein
MNTIRDLMEFLSKQDQSLPVDIDNESVSNGTLYVSLSFSVPNAANWTDGETINSD